MKDAVIVSQKGMGSGDEALGTLLLRRLERLTNRPILIGTWSDAVWAIGFYEKNGYHKLSRKQTENLLRTYWSIPDRQVVTSVVLSGPDRREASPAG